MDMNLQTLQVGSEQVWMAVPSVLYRGHSMVPRWLLRQYCGVTATWDPIGHTLSQSCPHRRQSGHRSRTVMAEVCYTPEARG